MINPLSKLNALLLYPICSQDDKFILLREAPIRNFRHRDQTKILEAEISESPGHGKTRGIIVWQPDSGNLRFILKGKNTPFESSNSLCFPYNERTKRIMQELHN